MFNIKKKNYSQDLLNLDDTITPSNWLKKMVEQVKVNTEGWKKKHFKKFRVDVLVRLLKRMDMIGHEKYAEKGYVKNLEEMAELLPVLRDKKDDFDRKKYTSLMAEVLKHYQMDHKLIMPYYYMVIGMVLGSFVGILFLREKVFVAGSVMLVMGFLGSIQDYRMKKAGRVI